MPLFETGATTIYYEVHGGGFPLLALAPGGMRSSIPIWANVPMNPIAAFADDFRVIAMDQRNAGRSSGPLDAENPWGSYVADQLALLDHLGIEAFHELGCCIVVS
jgi:pimeloyl-ACP methyl ester carboxylesterase